MELSQSVTGSQGCTALAHHAIGDGYSLVQEGPQPCTFSPWIGVSSWLTLNASALRYGSAIRHKVKRSTSTTFSNGRAVFCSVMR